LTLNQTSLLRVIQKQNSRKRSIVITTATIAMYLLTKIKPAKSAIAAIGVKFGGCGKSRPATTYGN